jgi:signal transduction histidine kinase
VLAYNRGQTKDPDAFFARVKEIFARPEDSFFDVVELADGRILERHTCPQLVEGKPVGRVWSFRDATARRHAEAQLAYERDLFTTLLDNLPDNFFFKDLQSRFVRFSKSKLEEAFQAALSLHRASSKAEEGIGLPPHLASLEEFAKTLPGKSDFDLYPVERAQSNYQDEQEIIRTGAPLIGKLERVTDTDRQAKWSLATKMAWRDKDGKIIGTFGISKDITDLKEAEANLELASRQAGMAEVATSVLHNIGNVLNSVNISVSVIKDGAHDSGAEDVAHMAALLEQHRGDLPGFLAQEDRAGQLITYLTTLARHLAERQATALHELNELTKNVGHVADIVATQQHYAKVAGVTELIQVSDLVEDALSMHARALARHEVQVSREYAAEVPKLVLEKHKLLQILVNLIHNAKHACDASGRIDKLLTVRVSQGGDRVRVVVADNGEGIPAENLTRIFNHGFTTRKNGHGFGLHSAALAAREMGGNLLAHSDGPGQGATFTIELPIPLSEHSS